MTAEPDRPITCYSEALPPIRDRVGNVLKIKYQDFDQLAGFADGLSGKVFGASQVKRLGVDKFFDAIRAAGLRIRYEEDPEQTAKMLERVARNFEPRNDRQARMNHFSMSNKLVNEVLRYLVDRDGGLTALNDAVKLARSNTARRAALKRKQQQQPCCKKNGSPPQWPPRGKYA